MWLRLTVPGTAGHGSMLHPDNAVARLAAAVARLDAHASRSCSPSPCATS